MMLKKIALITSALLIAVAITGCSKKPRRPNPLDTVMGQGSGGGYGNGDGGFISPEFQGGEALPERRNSGAGDIDNARRGVLGEASNIYFNFDSATISPAERAKLNTAAEYLRDNRNAKLVLEGHCDWRGTGEYNLALGDRRAKSVQSFLETLGPDFSSRLQTLSKGDLNATEGASSAQMAKERKVELLVVD